MDGHMVVQTDRGTTGQTNIQIKRDILSDKISYGCKNASKIILLVAHCMLFV